jgi:NADPH2:quinone reductase
VIAQELYQHVWPLLNDGKLKPVIYKTFAIENAADAHRLMESSEHVGKIVLTV